MKEIKLTQGKVALVDDEDFEELNQFKWYAAKMTKGTFYAGRKKNNKRAYLHREIMNPVAGMEVDHIDGDGLNCQRVNLRNCTHIQNTMNRRMSLTSTSGFKGVSWHKRDEVWQANIRVDRKLKYLGSFSMLEDAALAYNKAATKYFGEYAELNAIGA